MKLIDLVVFADHSQKIPAAYLAPEIKKETSSWKIFASHFIDFSAAWMITFALTALLAQSAHLMMVTQGLQKAFPMEEAMSFSGRLLPLIVLSYFFFSYFMNHGQTFGMHKLNGRIQMTDKSFTEAFTWALHSFALCFSGGLVYALRPTQWKSVVPHDYLYRDLMESKADYSINLIERIECNQVVDEEETSFRNAA